MTLLPLLLLTTCSNNTQMGRCAGYLVVKRAKRGWHDFLLRCHSAINFLKVVKHGVMSNVATYIILGARITGVSIHRNHLVRFTQLPTVPNKVLSVSHLLREMTTLTFFFLHRSKHWCVSNEIKIITQVQLDFCRLMEMSVSGGFASLTK